MTSLGFWLFSGWTVSGVGLLYLMDRTGGCSLRGSIDTIREKSGVTGPRLWWAISVSVLGLVLLAPFIWVGGLWLGNKAGRQYAGEQQKLRTGHQEFLFAWQRGDELPKQVRRLFDEHTAAVEPLGFECVGNYVMKELPAGYLGRIFLSEDGSTVSSVTHMTSRGVTPGASFVTVLTDGRVIDTAMTEYSPSFEFLDGLDIFIANFVDPEGPVEEAYASHLEIVRQMCELKGSQPICVGRDQATDVLHYENRAFGRLLHFFGRYEEAPPAPELPTPLVGCDVLG